MNSSSMGGSKNTYAGKRRDILPTSNKHSFQRKNSPQQKRGSSASGYSFANVAAPDKVARRKPRRPRDTGPRRQPRPNVPWQKGTLKWFNGKKGYGFIVMGDKEIFLHITSILNEQRSGFVAGMVVEFQEEEGPRGPRAIVARLFPAPATN